MCTGVRLKAIDNSIIYGRTLEFGQRTDSNILMIPRDYQFLGRAPGNGQGFSWKAQYAAIGANMMGVHELVDGVNEKGVAAGLFYFPGYVEYQQASPDEYGMCIAPWQIVSLILTTCASIDEVRRRMAHIKVCEILFDDLFGVPPVHVVVHDSSGKCLVIEFLKGAMLFFDNPIGVITNAPSFDWHLTNVNNYLSISPKGHSPVTIKGLTLSPFGMGSGGFGLPGDFTPPSRFVRALFFSQAIETGRSADESRDGAFHILNLFDIPRGVVCGVDHNGMTHIGYTQWTTVSDLSNRKYYWHTYDNRQIYRVDLMNLDLNASQPISIKMHRNATILDGMADIS